MIVKNRFILAGLTLPALLFAVCGWVHLRNGLLTNSVYPILVQQALRAPIPAADMRAAAQILRKAELEDSRSQFAVADAIVRTKGDVNEAKYFLDRSLSSSPASAATWTLYAQLLLPSDPQKAATALQEAFAISPYEYFWNPERLVLAAALWPNLDRLTRNQASQGVRGLWEDHQQRPFLLHLLGRPHGAILVAEAYEEDPETIRSINRWASAERRSFGK